MKKDYQKEKKLLDEFTKVERHARKNGYTTRKRYAQTMKKFISFLCLFPNSPSQLKGINNYWLGRFILHQQNMGCTESTIRTQISHLRYWHSYIPSRRFTISDNDYLYRIVAELKKENGDEKEMGRHI